MDKAKLLQELKTKMAVDDKLPLKSTATNLVFGDGNPDSGILFIGEGPGYWEDQKGIPFVGNAGSFLNYMLAQINIPRERIFITNVVHYRPPENRDPTPEELGAFRPYLDKIIEIIDPKIIVTLGRFSMAKFIPGVTITSTHGKPKVINWFDKEIIVIPMYHPAAGLRSTAIKMQTIEDFKKIPGIIKDAEKLKKETVEKAKAKETEKQNNEVAQMQLV